MYKKKFLFVVFEGIEGSGKTYQSNKLFNKIKNLGLPAIHTREPGGSKSAEKIRKIILTGEKNKFTKTTDALLYLAARNEHIQKTLKPAFLSNKIIICDRFIDSTIAYQVYGKKVSKSLVAKVHEVILGRFKPDLTFVLTVNIKKAFLRLKKRGKKNRYDKFSKQFYLKAQNAFIQIAKKNKKKYVLLDNSHDSTDTEIFIFKTFLKALNR